MDAPRPHDLIWLRDPHAFVAERGLARIDGAGVSAAGDRCDERRHEGPLPAWANAAWLARAPVVVRRDRDDAGRIPVGLRGLTRAARHGAWLRPDECARVVTPGEVARLARWRAHPGRDAIPALAALVDLSRRLEAGAAKGGWHWGLTGAVGFSLASGIDVLHAASDIDLLIDCPVPLTADDMQWFAELALSAGGVRLDIQVDTPYGGFALAERLRTGGRVLLKTDRGPVLCEDPWHAPQDQDQDQVYRQSQAGPLGAGHP
ncbi:malonate decarboxylase holo-ACP synthase [Cupriavidus plantarum]|uniref:malonate decarboxylase holo-ACP synthase n=1 Tax=Cupriavidus plantarum TaxID=942865 RepID=UPI0015CCE6EC|nr:malonate decarboxylase holo-ACP synthase [Cupriavidus plantarum]NYI02386.1 phosphoribosyl-dephospho-CoA transferase [Cupriavidus plantarum]